MQTQIFQRFLDKKANPSRNDDLLLSRFFDENIIAKANRHILSTPKVFFISNIYKIIAYAFYKR